MNSTSTILVRQRFYLAALHNHSFSPHAAASGCVPVVESEQSNCSGWPSRTQRQQECRRPQMPPPSIACAWHPFPHCHMGGHVLRCTFNFSKFRILAAMTASSRLPIVANPRSPSRSNLLNRCCDSLLCSLNRSSLVSKLFDSATR